MVIKFFRWLIVSAVLVISLSGFTVYGAPLYSGGSGEHSQIKDPVKVVCETVSQSLLVSDDGLRCGPLEDKLTEIKGLLEFIGNY